jgi:hypothetical protein
VICCRVGSKVLDAIKGVICCVCTKCLTGVYRPHKD